MPTCEAGPCSTSMNSASSCDSMVSINSGFSDDSMEHLSAEERACLMFLVETIESLETEDDSGLSNDEPSWPPHALANRMGHLASSSSPKPEELSLHNDPNRVLRNNQKLQGLLVPTPLVLANGNAKLLRKTELGTPEQRTVNAPNPSALNSYHSSAVQTASKPASSKPTAEPPKQLAKLPPSFIPEPPVKTGISIQPKAKESPPKTQVDIKPDNQHKGTTPEVLMDLIPPPSDFMDEPEQPQQQPQTQSQPRSPPQPHPQPQTQSQPQAPPQPHPQPQTQSQPRSPPQPQPQPQTQSQPQAPPQPQPQPQTQSQPQAPPQPHPQPQTQSQPQAPPQPQSQPTPEKTAFAPPPGFGMEVSDDTPVGTVCSPGALEKLREKASVKRIPEVTQKCSDQSSPLPSSPDTCHSSAEHTEPKSPPAVAPKPKKFPSSIIIKSQKDSGPSHSLVSSSDRTMMNPQKVHIEALKKLGLLKDNEQDVNPAISRPQKVPPQPAPAPSSVESAETPRRTSGLSSPSHPEKGGSPGIPRGASPRVFEFKSASMKRSGTVLKGDEVDQSSAIKGQEKANVELSPGQLRRNKSRPVSTGSLKDLSIHQQASDSYQEQKIRRSMQSNTLPANVQLGVDGQKSPRTHGISVVISPQSMNGEDRKQALRKLGLIKD